MQFNDLLRAHDIDPAMTALALHKPRDPRIRAALCVMAESAPGLFEAYQSTHPTIPEATLKARRTMAAFLSRAEGELTFIGLYLQAGWRDVPAAELDAMPLQAEMRARLGQGGLSAEARARGIAARALFDLRPLDVLSDLRGRLVVTDPGARNYMRLAERTSLPVREITLRATLAPPVPDWRALRLTTDELRHLPRDWITTLHQWRGVYLIVDERDGARYVGAAYGEDNLLGRWQAHVAGEIGVTVELRRRDTSQFRFSILELLSPAATAEEVITCEQNWMDRLHTRRYGLNA
ncbi:GIY-YIG nuclease family protein [Rhodobacteraceae bacterium 2376]|uniref:GIY-YIG nuclease family protein n=1 Tax=Rhabdonatronobacter sediminivivens TaxID=2743469 RepID=A0A7Z0HY21_9RHOB|nr:GIY-YIG nuclease family protein [Rhabdonatronobacter sediminivivens]NYS24408.1 GIY-YIG nuclease family protein [Rhabdonatronobacter sediminivivens]